MRIHLISPPSPFLQDQRVFPPLGILRVAAVLEKAKHEVTCSDSNDTPPPADIYGITATTPQMPEAVNIAGRCQGKTILGGPHATMVVASSKRGCSRAKAALNTLFDTFWTVISGDGELAIHEAIDSQVGMLFDADDVNSRWFVSDQTSLPPPARHLLDMEKYRYSIAGKRATSVVSQLGCPFGCGFCGGRSSAFYRRIRSRSVDSVIREVESIIAMGYEGIMFMDDEMNVSPSMPELMARLRPFGLALRGAVRASCFTADQATAMASAGFKEVMFGFESGSDRILRNISKGSREDNERAFRLARGAGMRIKALMSLGHPGESEETALETRDWLLGMSPDEFDVTVITPYPGSPYWEDAVRSDLGWTYTCESGDRLHQQDLDYFKDQAFYKSVWGSYVSYVWTDHLSPSDLSALRDQIEAQVRFRLGIPWPSSRVEHSMGQSL